jgi:hypothetical protein
VLAGGRRLQRALRHFLTPESMPKYIVVVAL